MHRDQNKFKHSPKQNIRFTKQESYLYQAPIHIGIGLKIKQQTSYSFKYNTCNIYKFYLPLR